MDSYAGRQVKRKPGDVWLCVGPGQYWTPIEAKIQKRVRAFLKIEPLGLYFFQPGLFFSALVGVILFLYLFARIFGSGGDEKHEL